LDDAEQSPRLSRHRDQAMPLLTGLLEHASVRRAADGSLALVSQDGNVDDGAPEPDLEALAARRTAGGGVLDSIFNMSNSILGAGTHSRRAPPLCR
jgi:sodium-coupled neutral amino acid transporter 11